MAVVLRTKSHSPSLCNGVFEEASDSLSCLALSPLEGPRQPDFLLSDWHNTSCHGSYKNSTKTFCYLDIFYDVLPSSLCFLFFPKLLVSIRSSKIRSYYKLFLASVSIDWIQGALLPTNPLPSRLIPNFRVPDGTGSPSISTLPVHLKIQNVISMHMGCIYQPVTHVPSKSSLSCCSPYRPAAFTLYPLIVPLG